MLAGGEIANESKFDGFSTIPNRFSFTELLPGTGLVADEVTGDCSTISGVAGNGEAFFVLVFDEKSSSDEDGKERGDGCGLNELIELFSVPQISS